MTLRTLASAVVVALALSACGPLKYEVQSSQLAVGASADIAADVKKDQGFTLLEIAAKNLAPANMIKEGTSFFVVWQRKDKDAKWTRVGALKYDEGARKGELVGVSVAEASFDLQITTESSPDGEAPSDAVIFTQHIN